MEREDGNPTGHESADPCCAEHPAQLGDALVFFVEAIISAEEAGKFGEVYDLTQAAIREVKALLKTPCERLRSGKGAHGKAAEDAQAEKVIWLRRVFYAANRYEDVRYCKKCGEGYGPNSAGCEHMSD